MVYYQQIITFIWSHREGIYCKKQALCKEYDCEIENRKMCGVTVKYEYCYLSILNPAESLCFSVNICVNKLFSVSFWVHFNVNFIFNTGGSKIVGFNLLLSWHTL